MHVRSRDVAYGQTITRREDEGVSWPCANIARGQGQLKQRSTSQNSSRRPFLHPTIATTSFPPQPPPAHANHPEGLLSSFRPLLRPNAEATYTEPSILAMTYSPACRAYPIRNDRSHAPSVVLGLVFAPPYLFRLLTFHDTPCVFCLGTGYHCALLCPTARMRNVIRIDTMSSEFSCHATSIGRRAFLAEHLDIHHGESWYAYFSTRSSVYRHECCRALIYVRSSVFHVLPPPSYTFGSDTSLEYVLTLSTVSSVPRLQFLHLRL